MARPTAGEKLTLDLMFELAAEIDAETPPVPTKPTPPPLATGDLATIPRVLLNEYALEYAEYYTANAMQPPAEVRRVLEAYTGRGGIESSQESLGQYFTPYPVCKMIVDMLDMQPGDTVFDPTCGAGRFFKSLPPGVDAVGIEIDPDAARIAHLLYPQYTIDCADIKNNLHLREAFDFVAGNPPFGLWWNVEPQKWNLASAAGKIVSQWACFEIAIKAVKPGGVVALVVPSSTFENDRPADNRAREFFDSSCLIRAKVDLPGDAFKDSGTTWPCSFLLIQRYPAENAVPFRESLKRFECPSTIVDAWKQSPAFAAMKKQIRIELVKKKTAITINTEFEKEREEFNHFLELKDEEIPNSRDTILISRQGHKLKLQPVGAIAACKLAEWSGDWKTERKATRLLSVNHLVMHEGLKGLTDLNLTLKIDPAFLQFLKGKRKFFQKESIRMTDLADKKPEIYKRNLQRIEDAGIWDKLFPYQRHDAAIHAIKNYSFLGYIQGLGKTRTGIAIAMIKQTQSNLFICYSRLTKVWFDEMVLMGIPADDICIIKNHNDLKSIKKWNIVSFETLRKQDKNDPPVVCPKCGNIVKGKICTAPNTDRTSDKSTCGWNRFTDATCPNKKCKSHKADGVNHYTGRYCPDCGYSHIDWKPGIYKRMQKLFSLICVDESQASKNKNSQQGQALRTLKAKHKIILTGTLLENYIAEAFWQLYWLLGGGSARFPYSFKGGHNAFCNQYAVYESTKQGRRRMMPDVKNVETFWSMMDTLMTRRTEKDKDVKDIINLPDANEVRVNIAPTEPEKQLYEKVFDDFENWYEAQLAARDELPYWKQGEFTAKLSSLVLVKLNALRMVSSCPYRYDDYTGNGTAKSEFVLDIVKRKLAEGKKLLISSAFKDCVEYLAGKIPGAEFFHGEMPIAQRNIIMERFQKGDDLKVLCVTTQCCNLGVTLTQAQTCLIYDFLWSPKAMEQMWKRVHRVGQTQEVDIVYLINQGMIDEDMNKLVTQKEGAIDRAMDHVMESSKGEVFSPIEFAEALIRGRKNKKRG